MTLWQAALLGILQGVTEFLPVSSSGHLALAQMLIPGFQQPGVVFDAMLHVGTAAAVVWYERRHILEWLHGATGRRLLGLLVLGTAATACVALPLRQVATDGFSRAAWIGIALVLTGCVVGATRWMAGGPTGEVQMTWRQAVGVGLAQGLAIFPGLSRSGMTIAAGLAGGLERVWAARFSFLLAVPAIAAATLVEVADASRVPLELESGFVVASVVGACAACLTGYFAIKLVIGSLSSRIFHRFAWYCVPLGIVVLVVSRGWLR